MVLVRLQGCGVGCPWCDTRETWPATSPDRVGSLAEALGTNPRYAEVGPEDLVDHVREVHRGPRWVLVTGGEPADQDLLRLAHAFREAGYRTALETSGTALGHVGCSFDWVCVSPKVGMPGGRPLLREAIVLADEVKMVVGKPPDIDRLDALLAALPWPERAAICLQPLSTNERATRLCIDAAIARGWRVSIQLHKYLGQR